MRLLEASIRRAINLFRARFRAFIVKLFLNVRIPSRLNVYGARPSLPRSWCASGTLSARKPADWAQCRGGADAVRSEL